ncbi:hypothetical protein M8C21_015843, partial [Ambrosia artemisiifolia]
MKLMGQTKKDGASRTSSATTSPSKLQDTDFVNNSLLASNSDDEVSSMGISSLTFDKGQVDQGIGVHKDHTKDGRVKPHQFQKTDCSSSSSVHPIRSLEDDNLDYDSNASSSSFEFHKHERSSHNAISRSMLRPMSSKWNDAEKWIINKQNLQNHNSKNNMQNRVNLGGVGVVNGVRGYSESVSSIKRVDFSQPTLQLGMDRFSFTPSGLQHHPVSSQTNEGSGSVDHCPESKDLKEIETRESCGQSSNDDKTGCHEVRSVCMRDMGTEMTPIPSQEPSMTSTPVGATTPLRSPSSSIPSSPRRGGPASAPMQHSDDVSQKPIELTEQEVKLRTRKEILQLGMQLGKTNITAWASKEDLEKKELGVDNDKLAEESFMREEIKIQAWESQQKAKLEAEMRKIEAEVEQKRAHAQAKMLKKIAMAKQKSEAKRAAAEAVKSRQAARAAAQAEYIRQTGRIPPSSPNSCC